MEAGHSYVYQEFYCLCIRQYILSVSLWLHQNHIWLHKYSMEPTLYNQCYHHLKKKLKCIRNYLGKSSVCNFTKIYFQRQMSLKVSSKYWYDLKLPPLIVKFRRYFFSIRWVCSSLFPIYDVILCYSVLLQISCTLVAISWQNTIQFDNFHTHWHFWKQY